MNGGVAASKTADAALPDQRDAGRLEGIELLAPLGPAGRRALEADCDWRHCLPGEQVLDRTSTSRDVFFVVRGRLDVVNYSLGGREIAYGAVSAGGCFGELAALDGEARSASVVAAERCLLAVLPPDAFLDLLQQHPAMMLMLLRRLTRIVRTSNERIMDLSTLGAVQRVHLELLRLAVPDPLAAGSWLIYPLPTQSQIAARASTTRETVARVVGQLQGAGLVKRKGRSLYIRDRQRLEAVAARLEARADPL